MTSPVALPVTPDRIRQAIATAAERSGVDFDYLYNQARVESSLNPTARAATSSARGLFQFTRQTWLATLERHGEKAGLGWASDAIVRSPRGFTVADPALRAAIDALRDDPEVASLMAGAHAADNRADLEAGLGRAAEPVDLYMAHFLGSAGAVRFLTAWSQNPDANAAAMFPDAAVANRNVFYASDGSPRSLGAIRARFAAKIDESAPPPGAPSTSMQSYIATVASSSGTAPERPPLTMLSIAAMPKTLSPGFVANAYARMQRA